MKTVAFRVREVLAGHSRTAAVLAVDAEGREVQLEVSALEGASIGVDEVLILSWATVVVPTTDVQPEAEAAEEAVMGRILDDRAELLVNTSTEVPSEALSSADEGEPELRGDDRVERELRALIGLT